MIFLTVGTQLPFDRLVRCIDNVCGKGEIGEEVFGQIGETEYKPLNFKAVKSLDKNVYDEYFEKASAIVSHAGVGTITIAMDHNKPIVVMPRLKKFKEAVNDHQAVIAEKFGLLGNILVANNEEELLVEIERLRMFVPEKRQDQAKLVAERIKDFLNELTVKGQ